MSKGTELEVVFVEDDKELGEATAQALQLEGLKVALLRNAQAALNRLDADAPVIVVSDVRLPGMDGIAFFARLREIDPELPVIFTTGHGDVAMAVEAMKNGAADFFTKPYSSAELVRATRRALEQRRLVLENRRLRAALEARAESRILGPSSAAGKLRAVVDAVAGSEIDVVIEGESGTGKSFTARLIHDLGPRKSRPFISVDAGVLAHEDAELLLFGRDPSSGLSRTGLVERANGGTLLLDDLEAASSSLRARLQALLESRSILPQGADRARRLNIRFILARRIERTMREAERQLDPFSHRLDAVRIALPPLCVRREDIAEYFRHFVTLHERELGLHSRKIGELEWRRIQTHDWPGNLRELSNFARAFVLGISNVEPGQSGGLQNRSLLDIVADFERTMLEQALHDAGGNVSRLQASLKTPRKTLYDKLAKYDLKPRDFR